VELAEVPLALALAGLAAYAVLGGADFGAGFWYLAPAGRSSGAIREHAYRSMGPVWEANHVWLIFVLVVFWTAYPVAFSSIASTLSLPLFIAAVGIILRGTAYALRSESAPLAERRLVAGVFSLSSVLTPFALGAVVGGIASGRVPVGNAEGDLVTSWLNPTSGLVGVLAVATGVYLAAIYMAADAARQGTRELAEAFRLRALAAGVVAGAIALGGLGVLAADAPELWDGLTHGAGLAAVVVSGFAGIATLVLVSERRLEPARYSAALAVAAVVAGWALAQRPELLPGLTVEAAAAGRPTLLATVIGVAVGMLVLVPSLALLFGLVLRGRLDTGATAESMTGVRPPRLRGPLGPIALACLVAGLPLTVLADGGWMLGIGVAALIAFVASGFVLLATEPGEDESTPATGDQPEN
jgi:cytochrome d ubiquinol oxidase subunit II